MKPNVRKRALGVLLSTTLLIPTLYPPPVHAATSDRQFQDITGHWAETEIKEWVEAGRISGYSDGNFRPSKAITRAEYIAFINRALNTETLDSGSVKFTDVNEDNWFYKDVLASVNAGMIQGYENGEFKPNHIITRQEAIVLTARYLKLNQNSNVIKLLEQYNDSKDIKSYATSSASALLLLDC